MIRVGRPRAWAWAWGVPDPEIPGARCSCAPRLYAHPARARLTLDDPGPCGPVIRHPPSAPPPAPVFATDPGAGRVCDCATALRLAAVKTAGARLTRLTHRSLGTRRDPPRRPVRKLSFPCTCQPLLQLQGAVRSEQAHAGGGSSWRYWLDLPCPARHEWKQAHPQGASGPTLFLCMGSRSHGSGWLRTPRAAGLRGALAGRRRMGLGAVSFVRR